MTSLPPPPPPPPPYAYTTQHVVSSRQYASFLARFGGYLLDQLLYGLLLAVFVGPAFGLGALALKDCDRTGGDGEFSVTCGSGQLHAGLMGAAFLLAIVAVWFTIANGGR